jgi:hypothetical protein
MKTSAKVNPIVLYALLLLLPASLSAAEQITVETNVIESSKRAIPHDLAKIAKTKGFDYMTAPSVTTKSGQQARVEIIRKLQPASVAPSGFEPLPVGVTIRVTPHLKGDKIAFTARLTVSEFTTNDAPEGQTCSVMSSRDLYVSGTSKDGEEAWFDCLDPNSAKKLTVRIRFTTK